MIFINEAELSMLRGFGDAAFEVPMILKKGAKGAVYIEGSYVVEANAPVANAVDTTGAGDVLAGAFLALRANGVPISKALNKAVSLASKSVGNFGVEHIQ